MTKFISLGRSWGKFFSERRTNHLEEEHIRTKSEGGIFKHLVAGGVAGAISRTCTAPLQRLKVVLQVTSSDQKIFTCLRDLIKEGGVSGLWRGNLINVIKIIPESATKFAAYEKVKQGIKGGNEDSLAIHQRFLAGAAAGCISQTVVYPMEVFKTRLTLRKTGQYRGMLDAATKIYAAEGIGCLYKGYVPNILGIIPYAGIDLAVYETLKNQLKSSQSSSEQRSMLPLLACGGVSSTLGQLFTYPLALVRTRMQAQVTATATMTATVRNIVAREGFLGLYKGFTPNFLKVMPAVSINYVMYEAAGQALGLHMT